MSHGFEQKHGAASYSKVDYVVGIEGNCTPVPPFVPQLSLPWHRSSNQRRHLRTAQAAHSLSPKIKTKHALVDRRHIITASRFLSTSSQLADRDGGRNGAEAGRRSHLDRCYRVHCSHSAFYCVGRSLHRVFISAGTLSFLTPLTSRSIWLQTKNYRKPLLQRYVVRILLMVPIYSIASWTSMVSQTAAAFLDPVRDIYEAFTIYTFFQLLINYLGGERALIIMTHGREPVHHLWPLNHVLPRVDISDPHTFLAIKRGILQYAWLKPILSLAAIIMKATGTYQEGYIGLKSGYFWSGIIYNISVTLSLYSLGLFWVCMNDDLKPFRPVPKFLCIKLIIFASYWQGFFLSILVWLGAIPDSVEGYTPDNLAAAIQDFLICIEMPGFAIAHWYAFSWHDFADNRIASARMPVRYAARDAFGIRDLIQDSKETFSGDKYAYRIFDSGDKIMAHEASRSRLARLKDGMRYERGGKGKYWIPKPDEINQQTPLLGANGGPSRRSDSLSPHGNSMDELVLDPDEELLYDNARKLEFGDWNVSVSYLSPGDLFSYSFFSSILSLP